MFFPIEATYATAVDAVQGAAASWGDPGRNLDGMISPLSRPGPHGPFARGYQAHVVLGLVMGMAHEPGETFTVLMPRQAGKNEVSAGLIAILLAARARTGGSIVVCAPSYTPQAEISIRRVRGALERLRRIFPAFPQPTWTGASLTVGRATATFLSASPEAHVAGHTASIALIADEAQEIDADWFDRQFRPMTASTGASVVLFGTPWNGETLLDRQVVRNRARDAERRRRRLRGWYPLHYEVGWDEVAAANPRYGAHVARERARLGERHPLFVTQYLLQTAAAAGRLLNAEDIASLAGAFAALEGPVAGERYVAGLDIGGDGDRADATVLTVARLAGTAIEVVAHVAWEGEAYASLQSEIVELARRWRFVRIAADGTGLGGPVVAALALELGDVVERVSFGAAVKSELGFGLLGAVRRGALKLHDGDTRERGRCLAELVACEARLFPGGRMRWGAPPGGRDDYAVSLALCVRAAGAPSAPRVARGRRREA